jgi:hypothetical protein
MLQPRVQHVIECTDAEKLLHKQAPEALGVPSVSIIALQDSHQVRISCHLPHTPCSACLAACMRQSYDCWAVESAH